MTPGIPTVMATYLDGNVRKATPNTVAAMRRSAASRQCPKCKRKSALKFVSDADGFGSICRWEGCDGGTYKPRQ